jgi:hypothetical protein
MSISAPRPPSPVARDPEDRMSGASAHVPSASRAETELGLAPRLDPS